MENNEAIDMIRTAFDANPSILLTDATATVTRTGMSENDINVSEIASILICNAGRWCERYASDFIITWDTVRQAINKHMATTDTLDSEIYAFGFHQTGVDHNEYIHNACTSASLGNRHYTKILAVHITDYVDHADDDFKTVIVTLADITNSVKHT